MKQMQMPKQDTYDLQRQTIENLMDGAIDYPKKMSEEEAKEDYYHLLREYEDDFPFASPEEFREMWNSMVIDEDAGGGAS